MSFSPLLDALVESLSCLPGVGRKTAQRMALHLLEKERSSAARLAEDIQQALEKIDRRFDEKPVQVIKIARKRPVI